MPRPGASHLPPRSPLAAVACVLLAALPACGDAAPAPYTLRLAAADGAAVATYDAVVTADDATLGALVCRPGEAHALGPARCTGARLELDTTARVRLTFKAQGTERAALDAAPGERGAHALALAPVPPPVATADYATGFAPDAAGAAAFAALAVTFPSDLGRAQVVKFYVDDLQGASGPPTVYFQDTRKHPLHYDFYRNVLGRAGTRSAFEQATYHGAERTAAAGTLIAYPDVTAPIAAPIVLTFFPSDDLTPAQALRVAQLIEARLPFADRGDATNALTYLPAGAVQEDAARLAAPTFAAAGAAWLDHAALYGGLTQQLLNPGVAFGTLRRLTPEELATTVVSFGDVLVLTRLPNDLPIVGGTLTEELQTPLAHVNVAARARGTPNLALLGAGTDDRVAPLLGQLVRFEVTATAWSLRAATLAEAQAFWHSRTDRPPFSPPADVTTLGLLDFDALGFDDALTVGVKAANLAELHTLLGDPVPDGFAVPFSAYDRFMATASFTVSHCSSAKGDCLQEGRAVAVCTAAMERCRPPGDAPETLLAYRDRLLDDPTFQSDSAAREASLDGLRWLIRHLPVGADFGAALDGHIAARFGAGARVRLRSSTNAEDLPEFSGAGLYDSYAADATGADAASLEIRKTWASVWNWRAFEERAFWNIDQRAVRMGVAVHPNFPDEQCNGVLITRNLADPTVAGFYVNVQEGELAVTNPQGGAIPEVFTIAEAPGGGVQVIRQRFSTLSPDAPLMTDAEVNALYAAAYQVQRHFAALYGRDPYDLAMDLEFKLHGPERRLIIKQARPYHDVSTGVTP